MQIPRRSWSGRLCKRGFDCLVALIAMVICVPLFIFAAIGIKLTSKGPLFYKASRSGIRNVPFAMLKFRTMHIGSDKESAITRTEDKRIFRFGLLLRKLKIDELPQLFNVLSGDMSLVGPRPEDPKLVDLYYRDWMHETLLVAPGITGPGSVYGYIYGDQLLDDTDPEGSYARALLPAKLALERAYLERADFISDLRYMFLTAWAIVANILGRDVMIPRAETETARRWHDA